MQDITIKFLPRKPFCIQCSWCVLGHLNIRTFDPMRLEIRNVGRGSRLPLKKAPPAFGADSESEGSHFEGEGGSRRLLSFPHALRFLHLALFINAVGTQAHWLLFDFPCQLRSVAHPERACRWRSSKPRSLHFSAFPVLPDAPCRLQRGDPYTCLYSGATVECAVNDPLSIVT